MYCYRLSAGIMLTIILSACTNEKTDDSIKAPSAVKKPFDVITKQGQKRTDPYYWLRERGDSAVIEHLEAENAYTEGMMAGTKALQDQLFKEMKSRIKEEDVSAPVKKGDYFYYQRYETGKEYAIHCRKKSSLSAPEEIIADGNELAKNQTFFSFRIIPNETHHLLAILSDTTGNRLFTMRIKDLTTGRYLPDKIAGVEETMVWYNDNQTLLYAKLDPGTLIANRIYRHKLGDTQTKDVLVYTEKDPTLNAALYRGSSGKYLMIDCGRTDANKVFYLSANDPNEGAKLIASLVANVKYEADERDGLFFIRTNDQAPNYRIATCPLMSANDKSTWKDFIPESKTSFLQEFKIFKDYMVTNEMTEGLPKLAVHKFKDGSKTYIQFDEQAYVAYIASNEIFESDILAYGYGSPKTPSSTFHYNMVNGKRTVIKTQEVPGYDARNYATERVMVASRDGKKIPMSIVYHREKYKKDGTRTVLQQGYGAYGYSFPLSFDARRVSLLDRGVAIAIAHVRGGSEMGGDWYLDGKMMHKKNTFNDFIDCSEYLIANKFVAKDKLFATGGSAGGLLMGAVINMRPDLYRGVLAFVPFVDIVTTMMDESIPLTTFEWKEWGNPNVKEEYDYMLSYSPYDNVEKKNYPNLLVVTGFNDSQVPYWEPAKWIAKLRSHKTDQNLLLLKTNMGVGHGGASGRFESLKDAAFAQAFLLDLNGIHE
jgi:oligopeptidase B